MTQPRFLKDQQHLGISDPDPEPRQHYEVHCGKCHWWGYESQLRKIYKRLPLTKGVEPELCCPTCCEAGWLEHKKDYLPKPVSGVAEKRAALLVAVIQVGRVTERLKWQRVSLRKK